MTARDDYPYRKRNVPMYAADRTLHEAMCDEIDRLRYTPVVSVDTNYSRHPRHYCATCSDGTRAGHGCINCRNTGMDQSPCLTCNREVLR